MDSKRVNKKLKKNKYRIIISILGILVVIMLGFLIRRHNIEKEISKYDNEILIVKGEGNQIDSLTLKEIRRLGVEKKSINLNNGLEKATIEGVAIEKIIGNLNINLKDRSFLVIEDNDGNQERVHMSAVLEPERVYLVYKIDGTPLYDISPNYGKMILVDTTDDSASSWITNVKTLDIE